MVFFTPSADSARCAFSASLNDTSTLELDDDLDVNGILNVINGGSVFGERQNDPIKGVLGSRSGDTGTVVDPRNLEGQLQSAIVFGLTAALYGKIDVQKGRAVQQNFHTYKMCVFRRKLITDSGIN